MANKRWWLRIHVWLGISVGLFWALQGLTGALLVFNRDLQGAFYGQEPTAGSGLLPLDVVFDRASLAAGAPVSKLEAFGAGPNLLLGYYSAPDGKSEPW